MQISCICCTQDHQNTRQQRPFTVAPQTRTQSSGWLLSLYSSNLFYSSPSKVLWLTSGVINEPSPEDPEVSPAKCVGHIQVKKNHPLFTLIQNSSNLHKVKRSEVLVASFCKQSSHQSTQSAPISILESSWTPGSPSLYYPCRRKTFFYEEIGSLKRKLPVSTASPLSTLTPFVDPYEIIRVGGRLQHSSLPQDTKHPIVLSHDSQLSTMVISDIHKLDLHSSSDSTLHAFRAQSHVLHPRTSINRVIRNCFTCKHRKSQPETPLIATSCQSN